MAKREIKLRVWAETDDAQAEMVYLDKGEFDNGVWFEAPKHLDKHHATMQWIGLKDKNGKEIWESDIVKTGSDKLMVIKWSERHASFVIDRDGWAFRHYFGEAFEAQDCEVVGNIYQNADLLKSDGK